MAAFQPGGSCWSATCRASSLRGHHQWLAEIASACGWPIVAEPTANLHWMPNTVAHAPLVLGSADFLAAHEPDLVLSVGLFGLSRPTLELRAASRRARGRRARAGRS